MSHYDLAIIGTGSGNGLVTPDFDDKRVAVVERHLFGGTCLNVGCIPTKMFVYAAEVAGSARDSARFGVDAHVDGVRWPDIRDRVFGRIDPIEAGGRRYRIEGDNTTAYLGHARFVGERELEVDVDGTTERFTADQVVVATGARPQIPDLIAQSGVSYHTSDTVMRMDELPASMIIVGAGVIACEFAHVFASLGVRITLVARGPHLLRSLDGDISRRFTEVARTAWDVRTSANVAAAEHTGGGGITVTLDNGDVIEADTMLVATGRIPNSDDIGAEAAGIDVRSDGRIDVDEYGRTSAEGVWALGDVSSPYQLKHVANAEARAVAHNLVHADDLRPLPHTAVPAGVFTHPQIAVVGATEEKLVAQGRAFACKIQAFGDTAYGWAMEDATSMLKVLADPDTGLILGAHSMGPHSTTLIQPLIMAMSMGIPARSVATDQYWIHPALAEVVENALLGLDLPDVH